MSLLRDATGVCFVWPPARAGRWGRGGRRQRARSAPSRDGFRRWGGMEGAMRDSERAGCAGVSLTVKMEGGAVHGGGRGEPLVLVLNWLWHDLRYIRE